MHKSVQRQLRRASGALHTGRRAANLLSFTRGYAITVTRITKSILPRGTEAYFFRNDFYPFVRTELHEHDPTRHDLLVKI